MGFGEKLRSAIDKIKNSVHVDKELIKEVIKDIQRALISSDVNVQLVLKISKEIETQAFEKIPEALSRKEYLVKTCYDVILKYMGGEQQKKLPENPESILLCGLFGSGKTTTTAKLAKFYKKRGFKVGVIAADVYRPAAYEQLEQLSKQVGCLFYGEKNNPSASSVTKNGLDFFKKNSVNLVIVDSAGRSALDQSLISELKSIHSVLNPKFTFLVISADIGQAAKDQAEYFNQAIGVEGVILTKLDGSAKGGGALTACYVTNSPIYFIGIGEKVDDFEIFDANRFLSRILGFGDLEGLLEKVKELQESQELNEMDVDDFLKADFSFYLFKKQLSAARKLGPFNKIINMLGMGGNLSKDQMNLGQEKIKKYKIILDSFTVQELSMDPQEITKKRIKRIAQGSGTKEEEVKELTSHVKKMRKMFKQFSSRSQSPTSMMKKMFGGKIPDLSKFNDVDPKQLEEMSKQLKFK